MAHSQRALRQQSTTSDGSWCVHYAGVGSTSLTTSGSHSSSSSSCSHSLGNAMTGVQKPANGQKAQGWKESGTATCAKPWPKHVAVGGLVALFSFLAANFPWLLILALFQTAHEGLRYLLGFDKYITAYDEGKDEDVTFAIPGTCLYAMWQLGMVQYVCERFETRKCKIAAVSSGALGIAVMLALEKVAEGAKSDQEAAERVRRRA